jgi:hypothetical protein
MSMMTNSKQFFDLIHESVEFGKIKEEKKCPFCGSELDSDRFKGMQVRIGRLVFLLRTIEEGSKTASSTLDKVLVTKKLYGGADIPEDYPKWWDDAAKQIYKETEK